MAAKNLLSSNGLIPAVVYEYSDDVAKGYTIKTEPAVGSSVEKDSVVTIYISKGPQLRVPDVANVDEETAKKVLTSNQLIPTITYEYSDTIIVGNVTRTEPEIGSVVEPNSKITVYLSYGPSYVEVSNVIVNTGKYCDYYNVYRKEDKLYIDCRGFQYNWGTGDKESGSWHDPDNTGYITGIASLTDNYFKSVPVSAKYSAPGWTGWEKQDFILEISLDELGIDKPNIIYVTLYIDYYHVSDLEFNLSIYW
jgi:hypothetical protein